MPDDSPEILGARPTWLTFDRYGTLVQWHEALAAALGISRTRAADRRTGWGSSEPPIAGVKRSWRSSARTGASAT